MPDSVLPSKIPVNVPQVNEPWGLFKSLSVARKNLLRILPEVATKQPIVSGKTGKRWHMLWSPQPYAKSCLIGWVIIRNRM